MPPWAMVPAQPRLFPIAASSVDSAVRQGGHNCTLNSCPHFWGRGGRLWAPQAWTSLPTRRFLEPEDPRSCPTCQTRLPGRLESPTASCHPPRTAGIRQERALRPSLDTRALPWIPGPPAPSGRAHDGPRRHVPLMVQGPCLSAVGAAGGWRERGSGTIGRGGGGCQARTVPLCGVLSSVSWE